MGEWIWPPIAHVLHVVHREGQRYLVLVLRGRLGLGIPEKIDHALLCLHILQFDGTLFHFIQGVLVITHLVITHLVITHLHGVVRGCEVALPPVLH